MSVIPYLSPEDRVSQREKSILPHGISGNYYITEGTPGEEWNPIGIIQAYTEYIQKKNGVGSLIIIGDIGDILGSITPLIRSLDMIASIKIV